MTTDLLGILATYGLTMLLAIPLGKYLAKVFAGKPTLLDFMAPVDQFIYRIAGIDPNRNMHWKENIVALLTINAVWLVLAFGLC